MLILQDFSENHSCTCHILLLVAHFGGRGASALFSRQYGMSHIYLSIKSYFLIEKYGHFYNYIFIGIMVIYEI